MYQGQLAGSALSGVNIPMSPIDRLKNSESHLIEQLRTVQDAIKALEENPALNQVLSTLLRVNSLGGVY